MAEDPPPDLPDDIREEVVSFFELLNEKILDFPAKFR
jgi:hypothetical protein